MVETEEEIMIRILAESKRMLTEESAYTPQAAVRETAESREYAHNLIKQAVMERMRETRLATDTSTCYTPKELGEVMTRYVRFIQKQDQRGVRLYELNRRFGYVAKRLGSTTRDIMNDICDTAILDAPIKRGVVVYVDPIALSESLKHIQAQNNRSKALEDYFDRAFYATKR